jgi:DNA-binding PadR family transcriptional regulator
MNDLELYFGAGPYLTPTRLEATLLALEDLGFVSAKRAGSRVHYSLTEKGRKALALE